MPDFDFNNEMCKSSELTESERFQTIGFHNAGFSRNDINKTLDFAKNDNSADYRDRKSTKTAPRSGRPQSIDNKAEHELKQIVKKCKRASVPLLNEKFREKTGIQVSDRTLIKYCIRLDFTLAFQQQNLFSHHNKEKIDSIGALREKNGQSENGQTLFGAMKVGLLYLKQMDQGVFGELLEHALILKTLFLQ